ncbi:MAG TPA: hypothetical protein VE591_03755 [Candidatus Acidoferrum sp.]|nr:hypothetical protein [Candidatus Acidoferrum sp.]
MNFRHVALTAVATLAVGGTAIAQVAPTPAPLMTPPAPPVPGSSATIAPAASPAASPVASPSASPASAPAGGRGGRRGRNASPEPGASETPTPPQFQTLDGVWEVQMQPLDGSGRTIYSHFNVAQQGDQISGVWLRASNQKVPFTGTFDGRLFQITVKDGNSTMTMNGYAENFADMVGLLKTSDKDQGTPFTASHRKKEKPQ